MEVEYVHLVRTSEVQYLRLVRTSVVTSLIISFNLIGVLPIQYSTVDKADHKFRVVGVGWGCGVEGG